MMDKMFRLLVSIMLLISSHAYASDWSNNSQISDLFNKAGIDGTFVLYDVSTNKLIGHNKSRAFKRYVPASTFKIANTLIGLSVGAVKDVDEVLPYGGHPQTFAAWEKDMTLREAITISNVPIYQELARRIGKKNMSENVKRMHYGNKMIGDSVDTFWLAGPLMISAVEQTRFLSQLAQEALPFPEHHQKNTQNIILLDKGKNWTLYGKSGWQNASENGVGWWVGWVEKDAHIYTFALNMGITKASDPSKRQELGKASLKVLGIL